MKIIIVGAGEVGFHTAERLSKEGHQIAVIDRSANKVTYLRSRLNALVVHGSGASSDSLEEADIAHTDLFISVANIDEVNLIACLLAHQYGVPRIVARIKSPDYAKTEGKLSTSKLGIDIVINPHQVVADEITSIVAYDAATEVAEFADGRVVFLGYPIGPESPLAGVSMTTLGAIRGIYRLVVAAITRGEDTIVPRGEDIVQEGDILYFTCNKRDLPSIVDLFGFEERPTKNIFVLGGGKVGYEVSRRLRDLKYHIKIFDRNAEHCERLAERLEHVHVFHAEGTDVETLRNEGIDQADVFIAVTNDDQSNILCSLLAKRNGVKRAVALVNKPEYVTLAPSLGIDACISPRQATAAAILKYVRRGEVLGVAMVEQSDSEVIELLLTEHCSALQTPLKELQVPRGCNVGAIVRNDEVIIPGGNDHLESGDHVIIFSLPDAVSQVEQFFA